MDDDSRLEKLINQCKSNDVDAKVDAVTKLQAEFEAGIQINDPDGLINVLKSCLRTSNQHLTAATISALPPLLPLLIPTPISHPAQSQVPPPSVSSSTSSTAVSAMMDVVTLRQVLTAFLPPGGVVDRLGDNREKVREKARETLVILGGLAFRSGATSSMSSKNKDAKGPETPLMVFERFLREGGLGSKVWRSREQAILTLIHIRRPHHLFPIRPYLPLLVDALEDTDAHVRECARQSVVELFTGPAVSDGARADLKKEMTKKSVRKTIVDDVLSKLIAGSRGGNSSYPPSEGSENGDVGSTQKEYVPPSIALQAKKALGAGSSSGISRTVSHGNISRPASRAAEAPPLQPNDGTDIRPVYITSSRDLENEFSAMLKPFEGKETEHNWAARERGILRVRGMLKGDAHTRYPDVFLACLKDGFIQWSLKALASLRTTVSANTCSLYTELATALGPSLDPFVDTLLTHLLKMAGFTKKIAAQQSQAAVTAIITQTSSQPRVALPLLWSTLQEKTVQARAFVVAHIKNYLEVHGHRSKHSIESSGGLEILEKSVKKSLADANVGVRESARVCFWVFEGVWRDRGRVILESLDSIARKQLEKVCPDSETAAIVLPPVTPKNNKKSSVAAAIAASRAKAKAIATSPPSLRHQATSTSHAVRAVSPPMRRSASPALSQKSSSSTRPSSPLRSPGSPPSRSRVTLTSMSRSVSSSAISNSKSSSSIRQASPPSSPVKQLSTRRRTSSPLAMSPSRGTTLRQAAQIALPASPPSPPTIIAPPSPRNGSTWNSAAVAVVPRPPSALTYVNADEESLLLASTIPIPEDSDSDMDESANLMSFSAAFEPLRPVVSNSNSRAMSGSTKSDVSRPIVEASNVLSTGSNTTQDSPLPIVEDALRARAEQAESAAERLLELVDPEEDGMQHSTIPTSLLLGSSSATPTPKAKLAPIPITHLPPATPVNRNTAILRQAAAFRNSPAPGNGHASSSLLDVLRDQKHETEWWLKRMTTIQQGTPLSQREDREQDLQSYINALEQGTANIRLLQSLALFCIEHPVIDTTSPTQSPKFGSPGSPSPFLPNSRPLPLLHSDPWTKNKNFEKLFNALINFLNPAQGEDEIEYGLIVLWEMLENQVLHIEGREGDVFSLLLTIRYCNKLNVLEATNTIRDALTTRIEPVYGLTTMHASLRAFHLESPAESSNAEVKGATYAFGLIALGKFILRLPAEILEEELPRLRGTLISALNDKSSLVIRESAAASIIAAQLILRDETHLFALLDGLADEKKNLLTYLFDKHGARGLSTSTGPSGMVKLEKEMRRLDTRTNTPPRPSP